MEQEDGGDVVSKISVGFMDAIHGTRRTVSYSALCQCPTCSGTGLKSGKKPTTCTSCNGSGEQMLGRGGFRIMRQCPDCG